jgi:hypothetical protein
MNFRTSFQVGGGVDAAPRSNNSVADIEVEFFITKIPPGQSPTPNVSPSITHILNSGTRLYSNFLKPAVSMVSENFLMFLKSYLILLKGTYGITASSPGVATKIAP